MNTKYDLNSIKALVVVSAKEHGKVYRLENGNLTIATYTAEHPPTHSDNEGFFVRAGKGDFYGSGIAQEEDDEHNLTQYIKAISDELSGLVATDTPEHIFIIEPEHLKGLIQEHLKNPTHIPVTLVKYGNHVETEPEEILTLLRTAFSDETDPTDPASVAGEENAQEKRKILEVGKIVSG